MIMDKNGSKGHMMVEEWLREAKETLTDTNASEDRTKALDKLEICAKLGSNEARYLLGCVYSDVPAEQNRWYLQLKKAAQTGIVDACYYAGVAAARGVGVEKNLEEAEKYLKTAAKSGDGSSLLELGELYFNRGVAKKDLTLMDQAAECYEKAGRKGISKAYDGVYKIGNLYFDGYIKGVNLKIEPSQNKAARLYAICAAGGHTSGECDLGYCYLKGKGVERDLVKASQYLCKAAEKGHLHAKWNLSYLYLYEADPAYRQDGFQLLAMLEDQISGSPLYRSYLHRMGRCYEFGRGAAKDLDLAMKYYVRALENGYEGARKDIEELEKKRSKKGAAANKKVEEAAAEVEQKNDEHEESQEGLDNADYKAFDENFRKKLLDTYKIDIDRKKKYDSSFTKGMIELDSMIGLREVKRAVIDLKNEIEYEKERAKSLGYDVNKTVRTRHMVFMGNPGTGKTEVAKLMAKILFEIGAIKENKCTEVDKSDLMDGINTAKKTKETIGKSLGGVLFIDEAYTLLESGFSSLGEEAINTLLKEMDAHRGDLVVIIAGYTREMRKFIDSNAGLKERFRYEFEFQDYNACEMAQIFKRFCSKEQCYLTPEGIDVLIQRMNKEVRKKGKNFANARRVRNIFERAYQRHSIRLSTQEKKVISRYDYMRIDADDFVEDKEEQVQPGDAKKRLNELVGLKAVKDKVELLEKHLEYQKIRKIEDKQYEPKRLGMNMVFYGNPGTGKTTVAKLIAQTLYEMGVIERNHCEEVGREDLVASYIGQTAPKTEAIVKSALGGVLFIDEAYTLSNGKSEKDFGQEAIDTLLRLMENERENLVVIIAGYTDKMNEFLDTNPGLRSRFTEYLYFEDYNAKELLVIFKKLCASENYILPEELDEKLLTVFEGMVAKKDENFGNAREVRNVFEAILERLAKRVVENYKDKLDDEDLSEYLITIRQEDIV